MSFEYEFLSQLSDSIGVSLTDEQIQQFACYYQRMIEKNKVMNLTGITECKEVIMKHFIDSLMLVKAVDLNSVSSIADMGTGAGFPGIPLKIAFPHLKVCLMDSLSKRLKFLDEVIDELKLQNITTLHGRAEDIGKNMLHREQYDLCVSRAVANLSTLTEYCLPLVKEQGFFISYKSGDVNAELDSAKNAVSILGGSIEDTIFFNLPDTDMSRSFVKIKKIKKTPKKYPRKAGLPSKEPIH
ncbi:MAG: 16S rRNA (guanine(527)-N(7))-methyltransferase RsmG [Lachnospiraceae bacterium]|nr:16S rRNA (guanine(527)-N(7))-methyltransferase RsmG [Lachnospiraceae bacterium]